MSTVRFKRDHEAHKKGDVASVPFHVGKALVAGGVVEYPREADTTAAAREAVRESGKAAADLDAANRRVSELEAENAKLRKEMAAYLDDATRPDAGKDAGKAADYDGRHVDELRKEAADRNLEGRSALTTKDDLVKALKADDRKGKK